MARAARSARAARVAEQAGMPPVPFDGPKAFTPADTSNVTFHRPGPSSYGKRTSANRSASGFNLRGVCEVLEEHGLDPIVEVSRILQERTLCWAPDGKPILDAQGVQVTKPSLGIDLRTKVLLELTGFVHPKLKAVEMTHKAPELTDEQVDARLAALLQRAAARALD